jgi:hypothetical protein
MDDDEWKALMYGEEPEEVVPQIKSEVLPPRGIINMPAMSAEIRRLRGTVETQDRVIKRLVQRIRNIERRVNANSNDVGAIWTDLDNKIDRRNG